MSGAAWGSVVGLMIGLWLGWGLPAVITLWRLKRYVDDQADFYLADDCMDPAGIAYFDVGTVLTLGGKAEPKRSIGRRLNAAAAPQGEAP